MSRVGIRAVPSTATAEVVVESLAQDGAVILDRALERKVLERLRPLVDPLIGSAPLGDNAFDGYTTRRVFDPLRRTRALDAVVLHPLVQGVVSATLTWPYQLGMTILSDVLPGETAQSGHRDAAVYPLPPNFPEVMVNTIWALDDFTFENGATLVAPGSHIDRGANELEPAEMGAGSVLIYLGSTLHAAGANKSPRGRLGFIVEHVARWLRPADAHPLAVGPELAAQLPEQLQELLGFNQSSEYFGFVAGRPPLEWLAATTRPTP